MTKLGSALVFKQMATPANPLAGESLIYPKSDGLWYSKAGAAGAETLFAAGNRPAPVAARRAIANSITNAATTSYAVLNQATERTALTSTLVKSAGFDLLLNVQATIVLSTAATVSMFLGLRINGTDYDVGFTTLAATGRTWIGGIALITSVTASTGSWTVEPVVKAESSVSINWFAGDDMISYSVQQV